MPEAESDKSILGLPKPDANGNVPAIEYARISMARKLILARHEAGLSQAKLAQRAGIRVETINRLEKGKHTPDEKTFNKIDRVLKAGKNPRY